MELQRHLEQLRTPTSWQSPLAVIAHIDLDAFYAQCQVVAGGYDPKEPLACRQWNHVIAVNYPARKFGVKRSMSVDEAENLCPGIHLPHIATYKKGECEPKIRECPDVATHKISLDLFRKESRQIFRIFKNHFKTVERAGIDEGFVDLGSEVLDLALNKFPMLRKPRNKDDALPPIPTELDLAFIGIYRTENDSLKCWHDVLMLLGSQLVDAARQEVFDQLHYTCSAGIASTKLIAKLGSGFRKPFNQTVITDSQIDEFLSEVELKDVWGLGGKFGSSVLSRLDVPPSGQIKYIRENFNFETLVSKIEDPQKALTIYQMVRGCYRTPISPRVIIKSMASVKNFKTLTELTTLQDLADWTRVHCADLANRIIDMDKEENKIYRPELLGIQFEHNGIHRSKQIECQKLVGSSDDTILDDLYAIAKPFCEQNVVLPTSFFSIEILKIKELPKEKSFFRTMQNPNSVTNDRSLNIYYCDQCRKTDIDKQEHIDWHIARDLQRKLNSTKNGHITNATKAASTKSLKQKTHKAFTKQKSSVAASRQETLFHFFDKK